MTDDEMLAHAAALRAEGKWTEAGEWAQRAVDERERVYGPDDPRVAVALHRLAVFWHIGIDPEVAVGLFKRALAIFDAAPAADELAHAELLCDYAKAWIDLDAAEAMLARATEIYERLLEPRDPRIARAWLLYAEACEPLHRFPEARAAVARALACSDDADIRAEADRILHELAPERNELGSEEPPGWIDRRPMMSVDGELLDIARDARIEGRHADAQRIEREATAHVEQVRILESNLASLACVARFTHHVRAFSFSRDGARLALLTAAGIHVIRTLDLAIERTLEMTKAYDIALAAHGSRILVRGNGYLSVYSADDGSFVEHRGHGYGYRGSSAAIAPDDDLFAVGDNNRIVFGRISAPGYTHEIVPGPSSLVDLVFLDDGATIAAANCFDPIQRWRVADGGPLPSLPVPTVRRFDVAPDGDIVGEDGWQIVILRPSDGSSRRFHAGHGDSIYTVVVSSDGTLVVSTSNGENQPRILVFRTADGERLHAMPLGGYAHEIRFSPDGRFLAIRGSGEHAGPLWLYGVPA